MCHQSPENIARKFSILRSVIRRLSFGPSRLTHDLGQGDTFRTFWMPLVIGAEMDRVAGSGFAGWLNISLFTLVMCHVRVKRRRLVGRVWPVRLSNQRGVGVVIRLMTNSKRETLSWNV